MWTVKLVEQEFDLGWHLRDGAGNSLPFDKAASMNRISTLPHVTVPRSVLINSACRSSENLLAFCLLNE